MTSAFTRFISDQMTSPTFAAEYEASTAEIQAIDSRVATLPFAVSWSEADQQYVGTCPDFPSLSWLATSRNEALEGIVNLVGFVVADMMRTNGI